MFWVQMVRTGTSQGHAIGGHRAIAASRRRGVPGLHRGAHHSVQRAERHRRCRPAAPFLTANEAIWEPSTISSASRRPRDRCRHGRTSPSRVVGAAPGGTVGHGRRCSGTVPEHPDAPPSAECRGRLIRGLGSDSRTSPGTTCGPRMSAAGVAFSLASRRRARSTVRSTTGPARPRSVSGAHRPDCRACGHRASCAPVRGRMGQCSKAPRLLVLVAVLGSSRMGVVDDVQDTKRLPSGSTSNRSMP